MKALLRSVLSESAYQKLWQLKSYVINLWSISSTKLFKIFLWHAKREDVVRTLNTYGLNVSEISDYYSPLPVLSKLRENMQRWARPSALLGVRYDIEAMKQLLNNLISNYYDEYRKLLPYEESKTKGYGPGFTIVDAMVQYLMIRHTKPRRYIEIGSGLSTYYCSLAAQKNAETGGSIEIACIDPYPLEGLYTLPGITVIKKEAQDVEPAVFEQLDAGDVLFIDSTHIVRIDGEVPYLFLEIIPMLKKGVIIHVHDIHFPYNIPYPPQHYIFDWKRPAFWTEAMLLQAFLSYNDAYEIMLSVPLMSYFCEDYLRREMPGYVSLNPDVTDTHFGSIWIEKVR